MSRKLIVCVFTLTLALSLAGCLSNDDVQSDDGDGGDGSDNGNEPAGENGGSTDPDGQGTGSGGPNDNGGDPENRPPSAELDAQDLSGASPFEVVFTLDGSDPDGDTLAWTLTIEDGDTIESGTHDAQEFPLEVEHTFTTEQFPGENHTVAFALSDGESAASGEVTIEVFRAPNPPEQGEVEQCVRNHEIPLWGIVMGVLEDASGEGELVEFESLTHYQVEADGEVQIAFMNEDGGRNIQHGHTGLVPAESEGAPVVKAAVCVYEDPPGGENLPEEVRVMIPMEGTSFTYQDGFPFDPTEP